MVISKVSANLACFGILVTEKFTRKFSVSQQKLPKTCSMRAGIRKCILIVQVFTQVHDTDMWNLQISINIRFSTQNYILSSSPHVVFIKELWYQGDLCIYFLKSVLLLTRSVFKLVSFTLVSANFPSKFSARFV